MRGMEGQDVKKTKTKPSDSQERLLKLDAELLLLIGQAQAMILSPDCFSKPTCDQFAFVKAVVDAGLRVSFEHAKIAAFQLAYCSLRGTGAMMRLALAAEDVCRDEKRRAHEYLVGEPKKRKRKS